MQWHSAIAVALRATTILSLSLASAFALIKRTHSHRHSTPRRYDTAMLSRWLMCIVCLFPGLVLAQPTVELDLLGFPTTGSLRRLLGSSGTGAFGVPVAGGLDCDGDTFADVAMASMLAGPLERTAAGQVYLLFGDGTISGSVDTATVQSGVLRFAGSGPFEHAGSEIWIDDVTGDGLGDVLIARQDFTTAGRTGAGALSIVVGGPFLRTHAATLEEFDLAAPPAGSVVTTIFGANAFDRVGIWMRTGDVTGDGLADIVVGADQQESSLATHAGVAYVIRGGAHLATNQSIDLASFGSTALAGNLLRIDPPAGSFEAHFGGTVQIADLDGNDRGEVLIATALNRAGATLRANGAPLGSAHGTGGSADGSVYIVWDDNIPAGAWTAGLTLDTSSLPGSRTLMHGGNDNVSFGEEILGGLDYDNDGDADLFIGDLTADVSPSGNRPFSGSGHVFYDAASLKGLTFDLDALPTGLTVSTFVGAETGDIAGDTAAHGDFDGDGIGDLAFSAPHGSPFGRDEAGIVYVLFGQDGAWPSFVDLTPANLPPPSSVRMTAVYGAFGTSGSDAGDTLSYSAAAGDIDGDGKTDFITNEMQGNGGSPAAEDTGNLIVLSGARIGGQLCPLDVDANGTIDANTDGVYVFRRLLGLSTVVPASFRDLDPDIADDATVSAQVDALGSGLDVDGSGAVSPSTDGVYVFRRLLDLATVVPSDFRALDPGIPSDEVVGGAVDALCP